MTSPKPPRLDGESEDDYYLRLIQKLANEKLALFARYQMELQEEEGTAITNLQSLKKSKGSLKRERQVLKEEDDIDIEIKTKTKKEKKDGTVKVEHRPVVVNEVTEGLKEFVKNEMNGSEIKLVIQKTLFASDLRHGLNRLSMPVNQLETNDFLTADEKRKLKENKKNKTKSGIEVGMLGPNLRMYDKMLEFKIWNMQCTNNYVLIRNWYNFVKEHHKLLKAGTLIQVWSFRINQQLCLAIVCPDDGAYAEKHDGENNDHDVVAASEV